MGRGQKCFGCSTDFLQKVQKLTKKSDNQQIQIDNFQTILDNKNVEILLKDETIKQQKKEIRKQKFLKILGFAGSVVLPILTLLVLI